MKTIYRALPKNTEPIFRKDDYVTPSERFALEHAETSAIYNGEDYTVIKAYMDETKDIRPASNPGEYLMNTDVKGKPIWDILFDEATQNVERKRILTNKIVEIFNTEINEKQSYTHILVDIQPEYKKYISFDVYDLMNKINEELESNTNIVVLYNGKETLDMIEETELMNWYIEKGLNADYLDNITFFDKGYAFFRYCMDSGIDVDDIVLLVKFMYKNKIYDSRDITESKMWDNFVKEYDKPHLRELLEFADDNINLPDLMFKLKNMVSGHVKLCGGGRNECLSEVEIALKALDINYELEEEFIYEKLNKKLYNIFSDDSI
jgi:hypothetical protein